MNQRALLLTLIFTAACTVSQRDTNTCVEGRTEVCACSNGASGAQLCTDGVFGPCLCDENNQVIDDEDLAEPDDDVEHDLRKPKPDMTKATVDMAVGEQPTADMTVVTTAPDLFTTTPGDVDLKTVPASTDLAASAKRLFVTKTAYLGNAVLTACQTSADAAVLGGTWMPWLTVTAGSAKSRISGNGPWKLLNGTTAFDNAAQLGTTPNVAIRINEKGEQLTYTGSDSELIVWTGTTNGGAGTGNNCSSWSSTSGSYTGTVGWAGNTEDWTDTYATICNTSNKARVYCFEQ